MEQHSFGHWLRLKRKSLDLTRAGLAGRVGCSAATIQKLEEEERRPSMQMAERMAEIFGIPASEQPAFLRFARGEVQSQVAEAQQEAPWNSTAKPSRSHLPTTLTSLVGREKEIAEVRAYLLKDDVHLVTLIGPPGIGKTRLSLEVARTLLSDFLEGVCFVALAPLDSPALIPVTVSQAMGYSGATHLSPVEQLKAGIGSKRFLIVLDNCEHLIEDAAVLAATLLSACPRLKILTTSRESLRIPGEWLYPVPALDHPDKVSVNELGVSPAVMLFAERARAVRSNFALNPENIETITAICKEVDGLPLAIELIAARMRLTAPQALLEHLHDRFLLSADELRAVPTRQKSLQDAIDWSYQLLAEDERKLFSYLSVFSGGFTLEAAEAIFARTFTLKTVSAIIASLLDKSLLQSSFDANQETRYTLLGTIREFSRQRLQQTGQAAEIRNWHLAYFLHLAGQSELALRGPDQLTWLRKLHAMQDNIRAALNWAIESKQTEVALQMASRLWWFWSKRSDFSEAREWLERVLAMPNAQRFSGPYADVLGQLAHHICLQIGPKEAKPFIERAVPVARSHGNPQTLANVLMVLGIVLAFEDNFASAQPALKESITLFRETHDEWGHAVAVMSLGFAAYRNADHTTALAMREEALTAFRRLEDQYFQSVCLHSIGSLLAKDGEVTRGLVDLRESLILSRQLGSKYESAAGLWRFAETEKLLGRIARAVQLYCAASNLYSAIGAWTHAGQIQLEERLAACRAALSEAEFTAAVKEGRSMTMEQAIAYALEDQE